MIKIVKSISSFCDQNLNSQNITRVISSQKFLFISCFVIFCFSIFLRSLTDIGADTGVYINVGKRIAEGGKYYYNFFEPNFPLSFYFYAVEYKLSQLLHIDQIIFSEIVINLLALFSIYCSSRILKNSTIFENKAHYNIIIISYFLGFFLRPNVLQVGEFGTKSSLLLILFFPYISYAFERKTSFLKKDLLCRGILMGLIPCIKPHYLILIIFIEFYHFCQRKSYKFFFELDKLVMLLIGIFYLVLIVKFIPEYFELSLPIWKNLYSAYDDYEIFLDNVWRHFAARINIFALVFLVFTRLRFSKNDQILAILFFAISTLMIFENIATNDQVGVFYAISTICFVKILFDLFTSGKMPISENKFIITALIILPIFDLEILPAAIFGLGGFVNLWYFLVPFYLFKVRKTASRKNLIIATSLYLSALLLAVLTVKYLGKWQFVAVNIACLLAVLFFYEKKICSKISEKFSRLSVFVITAAVSCLLYSYISSIGNLLWHKSDYYSPNKLFDSIAYYSKIYAPEKNDGIMVTSVWIAHQFPILNYLQKENYHKFPIAMIQARKTMAASNTMFPIDDSDKLLSLTYFFDDIKQQVKNPKVKLLFINNTPEIITKGDRCIIGALEYFFLDPEFRRVFAKEFEFKNRILVSKKVENFPQFGKFINKDSDIFDRVKPSDSKVLYDFEVYVRKQN